MYFHKELFKNIFWISTMFIFTLSTVNAAVSTFFGRMDPEYPHLCRHLNEYYAIGTTPIKEYCGEVYCTRDCICGIITCGLELVEPPCYLEKGMNTTYPGCCPRGVCPHHNEIGYFNAL